jgi:hypothetical protein
MLLPTYIRICVRVYRKTYVLVYNHQLVFYFLCAYIMSFFMSIYYVFLAKTVCMLIILC